ncbi:MAG: DUF1854 domain-containing protein [Clostridia bacterium]|nr:DUF1854 domain-containing protein [Clostridia bacterium]
MKRLYIDRYTGKLERTDLYFVRLTLKDGTVLEDLEPRRLFPITRPNMFITLLDRNEKEAAFVRDLTEIDDASRIALEECFAEYYMIPKITHLLNADEKFGALSWSVDTDRGRISFQIRNRNSDIKKLWGTKRVIIRDSNDNRYEIPDVDALDSHSKHVLFSYL